ncbi:MAG: glycosyltransferase [Rhodospirillaceae bacterium]|nr:glycosyltransferase [Rhodospirillaceae bacterium]MCA8933717.1 glycosyltransferase [Rhodospirillaceae bacterium]
MDDAGKSPIALFVYNRPDHARLTLENLRHNVGASETSLHVFSDGPRSAEDEAPVAAVRRLVHAVDGFRSVQVHEAPTNQGLANSVIAGVSRVLEAHTRVIVMEDDLVSSPHMLNYMNAALDRYEAEPAVFTVAAYNHPPSLMPMPADYPYDCFFLPRNSSWGWATWKDRWAKAVWESEDLRSLLRVPARRRAFANAGADLPGMLDDQLAGRVDSWAVRWSYAHFRHNALCLCPTRSYVDNIGNDGSGVHCRPSDIYANNLGTAPVSPTFPDEIFVDPEILQAFQAVYRRSLLKRLKRKIRTLGQGNRAARSST